MSTLKRNEPTIRIIPELIVSTESSEDSVKSDDESTERPSKRNKSKCDEESDEESSDDDSNEDPIKRWDDGLMEDHSEERVVQAFVLIQEEYEIFFRLFLWMHLAVELNDPFMFFYPLRHSKDVEVVNFLFDLMSKEKPNAQFKLLKHRYEDVIVFCENTMLNRPECRKSAMKCAIVTTADYVMEISGTKSYDEIFTPLGKAFMEKDEVELETRSELFTRLAQDVVKKMLEEGGIVV